MATNFPTSLDSLTNPSGSDYQNGAILHSAQHANANDAIEALQTKLGINSSADTSSIDYLLKHNSSVNPGHKHTVANINDYTTATDTRADNRIAAARGAANGIASLNSSTKVPASQIAELDTTNFAANIIDNDATLSAASSTRLATQSAVKTYVDNMAANISWKQAVRVATVTTGTLASAYANGQVVDGISLVTGDRILIKNQASGTENGIYRVNASGAPTRTTDADTGAELINATILVEEGSANANTQWTCSNSGTITIGSTTVNFAQIAGAGVYTNGTGITLTGNSFSIANNAITDALIRQSAGLSLIGRSANSTGNIADITAGSDGQVLRRSGTAIGFGALNLSSANAVTNQLPIANGGTGATTQSAARTALGLGTAAVKDTGTSGNNVPLLDGNNTHSGTNTFSADVSTVSQNSGPLAGFRNKIINGNFLHWIRGTSFTGGSQYSADRWYFSISGTCTASRQTDSPTEGIYSLQWLNGAGSSYGQFYTALESADVVQLRGRTLTLSVYLKTVGGYTGTYILNASYNTSTDVLSSQTTSIQTGSVTPTSSWARYTLTFTVPTDALGLRIAMYPSASQASGAGMKHALVQLEEGSVATPFEFRHTAVEKHLCERYAQIAGDAFCGIAASTTSFEGIQALRTEMRATPTAGVLSGIACSMRHNGDVSAASPGLNAATMSPRSIWTQITGFTGLTTGTAMQSRNISASGFILLSAEL